jgi:hypothetical protein
MNSISRRSLVEGLTFFLQHVKCWRSLCTFAGSCVLAFGLLNSGTRDANASSEKFAYESAVGYCRGNVARPIALSGDQSILCFDGWIATGQDLSSVENLKENGLFVVRSFGGSIKTAIALAGLLRDRHATVVVYDYCNSACASYLFIATDQTVVRKNSIVVWHHMQSGFDCYQMTSSGDDGPKSLQRSLCLDAPPEYEIVEQQVEDLSRRFYRERILAPGLEPPQSFHVKRVLKNMIDGTGVFPDVAWTWNPRFYKNVLKTKVTYEAYPESQAEVDEMVARFGFRRVIYDP